MRLGPAARPAPLQAAGRYSRRHGVSRQRRSAPPRGPTPLRVERSRRAPAYRRLCGWPNSPGPGHWATGQRAEQHKDSQSRQRLRHRGRSTTAPALPTASCTAPKTPSSPSPQPSKRAALWMREQGCGPVQAVMSDNALCYSTSTPFLPTRSTQPRRTPDPDPAVHTTLDGKIERFFGTLDREWVDARTWPNSHQRDRALSSFLALLQPQAPTLGRRRPTTHQPRPASP